MNTIQQDLEDWDREEIKLPVCEICGGTGWVEEVVQVAGEIWTENVKCGCQLEGLEKGTDDTILED